MPGAARRPLGTVTAPEPPVGEVRARPHARIRSFARRGDRMPQRHRAAYEAGRAGHVLDLPMVGGSTTVDPAYRLDVAAVFGRSAPLVVEVGSGSGDAILSGAANEPGWDFLAIEVWRPGVAQALARMAAAPLPNVRFAEIDAAPALATMLPAGSVHELWTFFPDPWPKQRHRKRRLIRPEFVDSAARLLAPDGRWRIATDWDAYADHVRAVLEGDPRFGPPSTEGAPLRPVTRFERKGAAAGRTITDLAYRRAR